MRSSPKLELDNNIKIEPNEDINQGMKIILATDRNNFGIDNQVQNIRDTIEFEDFDSPMKTESKEDFKPKLEADMKVKTEADVKAEIAVKSEIEFGNNIKIESFEEINHGMEIILASNRNNFSIDDQVQNIKDSIVFEDFDSPMKTESKENFKPKLEADMKVKTEADGKAEIEVKPKVELGDKIKIEPFEEINHGMEIILASDRNYFGIDDQVDFKLKINQTPRTQTPIQPVQRISQRASMQLGITPENLLQLQTRSPSPMKRFAPTPIRTAMSNQNKENVKSAIKFSPLSSTSLHNLTTSPILNMPVNKRRRQPSKDSPSHPKRRRVSKKLYD